jgi:NAD(P)-dependent dehydrogenase (short-subunit alcohol dehydrogenase family)
MAASAARALAAEKGLVFLSSRSAEHCAELSDSIVASGGRSAWLASDLAEEGAAEAAVRSCVEAYGRLDAVFSVAGISGREFGDGPLHECTLDGWETTMEANAKSTFLVCRAAVRQMLVQDTDDTGLRGAILVMSSVLVSNPDPRHFATHAYAASKGAVEAFSRSVAAYYAPYGIRVNAIAPAFVATPMSQRAQQDPAIVAYLKDKQALAGGIIDAEDTVGTVLFLLSEGARIASGQVIAIDGGWAASEC